MKAWVRRQVDQLCQHANASFTDIQLGGLPTDEFFGATGDEGVSESAARSDHLHGMPDIEDILADHAFFFDDVTANDPSQFFWISPTGTMVVGGRDSVGAYGAFGSVDLFTPNLNTVSSSGIMLQSRAAISPQIQVHLWQRVEELQMRCSPGLLTADMNQCIVSVGGMRSSVASFGASAVVTSITDGVYFLLTTDASGVGNWIATTQNNGSATSVDTGVSYVTDGTNIAFQTFKINYSATTGTAVFSIDDEQVASIATTIPPSTRKLAGFGCWKQAVGLGGAARTLGYSYDRLLYVGARVAS